MASGPRPLFAAHHPRSTPPSTRAWCGLVGNQPGCDHRAHRAADHVDLLDAEVIEDRLRVVHHGVAAVPWGSCGLSDAP